MHDLIDINYSQNLRQQQPARQRRVFAFLHTHTHTGLPLFCPVAFLRVPLAHQKRRQRPCLGRRNNTVPLGHGLNANAKRNLMRNVALRLRVDMIHDGASYALLSWRMNRCAACALKLDTQRRPVKSTTSSLPACGAICSTHDQTCRPCASLITRKKLRQKTAPLQRNRQANPPRPTAQKGYRGANLYNLFAPKPPAQRSVCGCDFENKKILLKR